MGNCCSCFRAVFKPNTGTTTGENVPLASRIIGPLRRGNSLLPKPPTTAGESLSFRFQKKKKKYPTHHRLKFQQKVCLFSFIMIYAFFHAFYIFNLISLSVCLFVLA